jgi:hypothetical protein
MSIRYHLILRLFIASTLLIGGVAWFGYKDVKHETRELFDDQLVYCSVWFRIIREKSIFLAFKNISMRISSTHPTRSMMKDMRKIIKNSPLAIFIKPSLGFKFGT